MSKLKILLVILLASFFLGSVYLTWYLAQRKLSADQAATSSIPSSADTISETTPPPASTSTSSSTTTSTESADSAKKVTLILQPGYNLKTIPYILSPNDGKTVFLNLSSREVFALVDDSWSDLLASGNVSPGQAVLIKSTEGEVYTIPVSATPLDQDKPFTIRLKAGWNAIGNPFTFDLKWNPVIKTSKGSTTLAKAIEASILAPAFYYDPAGKEYIQIETDAAWKSFQGLLIKAGGEFDLIIDPTLTP